jgi:transcriptional regulator with XRE-family HTH domain
MPSDPRSIDDVYQGIRRRLIELRGNLTQQEAADLVGLSLKDYQRSETLNPPPEIPRLLVLAKGFGVSLNDLIPPPGALGPGKGPP